MLHLAIICNYIRFVWRMPLLQSQTLIFAHLNWHHNLCAVNWCQHWFEYFPNPPLNILSMVENVLAHHDQELLRHLVDRGITSQVTVAVLSRTQQ